MNEEIKGQSEIGLHRFPRFVLLFYSV